MDKKFEILNYDELPKRGKIISWKNIKPGFVFKTYHIDYGYNEFEFKKCEGSYLFLKYKNLDINKIKSDSFVYGKIGKIVGEITSNFKIEIGTEFKDNKRYLVIIGRKYEKDKNEVNRKWYKYKCLKCGWTEGWIVESHLIGGNGCSCCSGKTVVPEINSIYAKAPWMMRWMSEEDAKKYTPQSREKIIVNCPDCGEVKNKRIRDIYKNKSMGCTCGDGFSYPEKFMYNVLKQVGVRFETQYSPDYLKNKRSDFYLPEYRLVIEMDGELGHEGGITHSKSKRTLEELIAIDKWKDEQHKLHGCKVIRINCSKSKLDFIKDKILKSNLSSQFEMENIDWEKADGFAWFSNLRKEVCDRWKNKEEYETVIDMLSIFNLSRCTVIRWLKKGTKLGWCDYNPKEEMRKSASKNGKSLGKSVAVYKNGQYLKSFISLQSLEEESERVFGTKLYFGNVASVARGEKPQYKGFTFKYVENNE